MGDSRIMKRGRIRIPKEVREKLNVKDEDFFTNLLTKNGFVKIKNLEFNLDKAIMQIERLKKRKIIVKLRA